MSNLNFCGMFEELTIDGMNSGSGSEAPILLAEEEFNADKIIKELEDLHKHVKALGEVQDRYFDRLEKRYERIEKESEGEEL